MKCAWQTYLGLIPVWMRENVDKHGKETLLELRLRLNEPPELVMRHGILQIDGCIQGEDLRFCINMASRYSPWAAKTSAYGFITAPGGHRIGLCGSVVTDNHTISGIHDLTSLCLRVARDFDGIAKDAIRSPGSVLIIGKPGSGKTTFLRDYIRQLSNVNSETIAVIDEREEIFPRANDQFSFARGRRTDVISGCPKAYGIEMMLRNMTPSIIAVDEITAKEDCEALLHAGWCGAKLIATAHAGTKEDLLNRPIYRPLIENHLFDSLIVLHSDKSWHSERMNI